MKIVCKFLMEKETKGAVRYQELYPWDHTPTMEEINALSADSFAVGTLYVRKSALGQAYPKELTMTLEA